VPGHVVAMGGGGFRPCDRRLLRGLRRSELRAELPAPPRYAAAPRRASGGPGRDPRLGRLRRPAYQRLVDDGFPAGYAADDGAALHFAGSDLIGVVATRPGAVAYRVEPGSETPLEPRLLFDQRGT